MPGYCDTIAPSLLKDCVNVTVSYSPEFIAQGAIMAGTLEPDMVSGTPAPPHYCRTRVTAAAAHATPLSGRRMSRSLESTADARS